MRCQKARKFISLALDGRLDADGHDGLAGHLRACPACRLWQQEQFSIQDALASFPAPQLLPGFSARLQERISNSAPRPWLSWAQPGLFHPAWTRAAMILLLILSTAAGFFLGATLLDPSSDSQTPVFDQTLNLNAFADLPVDSFGAVYERLLQGELQ